jgi:hypothetical protein
MKGVMNSQFTQPELDALDLTRARLCALQLHIEVMEDRLNARHRGILDALMHLTDEVGVLFKNIVSIRSIANEVNNAAALLKAHKVDAFERYSKE